MKKTILILISILLVLSVSASIFGYYYSNKKDNNNTIPSVTADNELKEYFKKIGKTYDKIYTSENIELKNFTFDKEIEKSFMDNFIIENLEYSDFNDSGLEKYKNQSLIDNWLFAYIVTDENVNEACFSKELLINTYEKIFNRENVIIEKIFNDNEITDNYVCYSKKKSDVKEYNHKEAKALNTDDNVISYYEIKDNKDKIHYISVDIDSDEDNINISNIYSYNIYQEKTKIEDMIKDREFDKKGYVYVGNSNGTLNHGEVNYIKENGSYELENGEIITLNNGKLIFKEENKQVTVPIENIKEVIINGKDVQQLDYEIYFFNNLGELYYYDKLPYEYTTLEDSVKNYKKILTLDKKIKNFVFRVYDLDEYDNVLEILLKLEDNTLYSIKNNKKVDYLVSLLNDVKIYENKDVEIKNKIIDYKFKSLYDIQPFINYGYNYLYDVDKNKLVSNSKIDEIYKSNEEFCDYSYLVTFENKETVGIGSNRCS